MSYKKSDVLEIAQKLADKGFLRRKRGLFNQNVVYCVRGLNLEFYALAKGPSPDYRIAEIIASTFAKYDFEVERVGSIILVKIDDIDADGVGREIEECFKEAEKED